MNSREEKILDGGLILSNNESLDLDRGSGTLQWTVETFQNKIDKIWR